MLNIFCGYKKSGEALLQGLKRSRITKMVGTSHEEHGKEGSEVRFTQLEQSIIPLTKMASQLLVMKKEGHSVETLGMEKTVKQSIYTILLSIADCFLFFLLWKIIPWKLLDTSLIPRMEPSIKWVVPSCKHLALKELKGFEPVTSSTSGERYHVWLMITNPQN